MSLSVDIVKDFGDFKLDVAFQVGHETLGFLGESGCGKSLTLRCIAGIERPDEGKIVVNDQVFFDKARGKKARVDLSAQERKTALLFQNYQLFPNLTVEQNILAGMDKSLDSTARTQLIDEHIKRFNLNGLNKRYPAQLSGGQQQRVALARMLAATPSILMLDEPFAALDAHLKSALEQDLQRLFEQFEGSILYVSHDIDEAFRFCDRIAVVHDGRLEEIDTKERIIHHPQTLATLHLSGCKNTTEAVYQDEHHAFLPRFNISIYSDTSLSPDVKYCGIRAKFVAHATDVAASHHNVYQVKVEHISDSRFERTALIRFLPDAEGSPSDNARQASSAANSTPLASSEVPPTTLPAQHNAATAAPTDISNQPTIQWHINKLATSHPLPEVGDICKIAIKDEGLYFVNR